ncbi:hypothetical protein [Deinococcus sedimenti]|uniref:Uncharacterized protein n=1 Tax=Deinococcus sedimenti TaxID=1867090 RepID=A0ABQ2S880_9DEIO|nr:hypothetical protein [Deinococcus sedimenti]GGR98367.1 hypothetical protein GCM10008960_26260 [Deinococcus sedimenti]
MTQNNNFTGISLRNGQLYATRQGRDYALFIYTPLREAYTGQYEVPFGVNWQQYNKPFVKQYVPMPVVSSLPSGFTFTSQDRPGDTWYGYQQQICNGWPLYYVENVHQGGQTMQPAMFEPAMQPLTPPNQNNSAMEINQSTAEGEEVGFPGPYLGP